MILIDNVEILTVIEPLNWNGATDNATRSLDFSILYNPEKKEIPKYKFSVNSKVEWVEDNKTLFLGYITSINYNTGEDSISISCIDFMSRLVRSKCIGRFKGTLNEIANKICASFNLKNGINIENKTIHNIVSTGDLTYFDVLTECCKVLFTHYNLYLDGTTLKLTSNKIVDTFEIGKNIRSSSFSQSLDELVTKVLIIDNNGKVKGSVQNDELLSTIGLFQEVYNYNKDCKNNTEEAKKLLKGVKNEASIVVNNNNECIAGRYIKVIEPVNNFIGTFFIKTDAHTIGADSQLSMEIEYVK